jgi:hypothetical protein
MEPSSATWRTSSYSGNNGGQCIETADAPGCVLIRDAKDRQGVTLSFPATEWRRFTSTLK